MKDWNYENEQWTQLPYHLKHLPLFTRYFDPLSFFFRVLWFFFLKVTFHSYVRLQVRGDFDELHRKYPKLILISNHSSHLDAVSIAAAIPFSYWLDLYITAAKDYFFVNPLFTFFSKHCLGAIPIDRKDRGSEAIELILSLLTKLPRIWLILFPEGTRSKDGYIQNFKRGVSVFSEKTSTPILFLYLQGSSQLWPKGAFFAKPGQLILHVGPVHQPAPIKQLNQAYREWVLTINAEAYRPSTAAPLV